jgi:hypothetical protein
MCHRTGNRLTAVSGAYSHSYAYNQIGNLTSKNGASYSYGTKPHAVTLAGSSAYSYDNNSNLILNCVINKMRRAKCLYILEN